MNSHKNFKNQRPRKKLLIAGQSSVLQAINEGTELERIYILNQGNFSKIKEEAALVGIPVHKVPAEKLKSFNIDLPDNCVALKSKIHYQDLQDTITWIVEKGEIPLILILDGITDIRNIGGMARTALCCGVHALVIPYKGVGILNEDAINASAGALEQINICRVNELADALELCKLNGLQILASEMKGKVAVYDLDLKIPSAIIMGSEDEGIRQDLYKKSDFVFYIPMKNSFESLNVGAATSMILYEVMRQRK